MSARAVQGSAVVSGSKVVFSGTLGLAQLPQVTAAIEELANEEYILELDFTSVEAAMPGLMLPLICLVDQLRMTHPIRARGPASGTCRNLFVNTNWISLLDPDNHNSHPLVRHEHLAATRFTSASDQQSLLMSAMDVILRSTRTMNREDLAAVEWSIGEIMDNVFNHAGAPSGGIIQVSTLKKRNCVQFVIVDGGHSIPGTLRSSFPDLQSDADALAHAVKEGVTRDKSIGQGNGLFGTYSVCTAGDGNLHIRSGRGNLYHNREHGLHLVNESNPVRGTVIDATVSCQPGVLSDALQLNKTKYKVTDRFEYELDDRDEITIEPRAHTESYFARRGGVPLRIALENLLRILPSEHVIVVDMSKVQLLSSSFADEAFAKLCAKIGRLQFTKRFRFMNANQPVHALVMRALEQRMSS